MRKVLGLVLVLALMFMGVSYASDITVSSNGTYVKQASGVNFKGPAVTDNGTGVDVNFATMTGAQNITGDVDIVGSLDASGAIEAGSMIVDGSIYTATLVVDGGIYPGRVTSDPCGTLGGGYIFFNATAGQPCYCNDLGVDLMLYNGSTACF